MSTAGRLMLASLADGVKPDWLSSMDDSEFLHHAVSVPAAKI